MEEKCYPSHEYTEILHEWNCEQSAKLIRLALEHQMDTLSFFASSFQILLFRYGYRDPVDNETVTIIIEVNCEDLETDKNTINEPAVISEQCNSSIIFEITAEISRYEKQNSKFHELWAFVWEKLPKKFAISAPSNSVYTLQIFSPTISIEKSQNVKYPFVKLKQSDCYFEFQSAVSNIHAEFSQRFISHFCKLMESILDTGTFNLISSYEMLTTQEKQVIIYDWNATNNFSYDLNRCIHHLFEEQVEKNPNLPCVIFQSIKLSYAEINERSTCLASYIRSLGVKTRDFIAVALPRSEHLIVSILSILKVGCAYVPIDLSNPKARLQFILDDAEPSLLITTEENEKLLRDLFHGNIISISGEFPFLSADTIPEEDKSQIAALRGESVSGESTAYLIYTSGSTGHPKGVCCSHRGLTNRIMWMRDHYKINSDDKVLHKTSIGFDVSLWELLLPLVSGSCLVVAMPEAHKDSQAIINLVDKEKITVVHFVPSMLRAFLQSTDAVDSCVTLRHVFASGEALTPDIVQLFYDKLVSTNATLHNLYGPTEASIDVSFFKCDKETRNSLMMSIPIGRPISNTQLYILNDNLQSVPVMVVGELCIGGVGLAKEYLKRPELTRQHFIQGPVGINERLYRTGDMARYLADGNIEFLGRKDSQVKIRGFRIELEEIQRNLMKNSAVDNAVVIAREDVLPNGNKTLVAYVQLKDRSHFHSSGEEDFVAKLHTNLELFLPFYMIPHKYVFLDSFPLTLSGKLDRKALPKPVMATALNDKRITSFHPPRTDTEKILVNIWSDVMGLEQGQMLSIRDNFFRLGGDSIISIQIRSRAKDDGLLLTVRDIFEYPTIEQLSAALEYRDIETQEVIEHSSSTIQAFGEIPLTPVQCWFFLQDFENINYWNQRVLVRPNKKIDTVIFSESVEFLPNLHEILNVRYTKAEEENLTNNEIQWFQYCHQANVKLQFCHLISVDMNDVHYESEREKIEAITARQVKIENSINFETGILWGVTIFDFGNEESSDQRFVFFAHHLLMDGVSLRVIVSDLEIVYTSLLKGREQDLHKIRKTSSFRSWAFSLHEYAKTNNFDTEIVFWTNVLKSTIGCSLPPPENGSSSSSGHSVFHCTLDKQNTNALLHKVQSAYKTEINDILLTAFLLTLCKWSGTNQIALELEGHGREEEILRNVNIDLSKTVGWFTSQFPVCLRVDCPGDIENCIKMVKEQLRKIPNRGISYGILKYLSNPKEFELFDGMKEPEICFNYLGQFDNSSKGNSWSISRLEDSIAKENHLHKKIIVDSAVCEGILEIAWTYVSTYEQSTIENLANMFTKKLVEVTEFCCSETAFGYTPSDFPLMERIEQKTVDNNFGDIKGIVDVYPLSPMQLGMYFQNCLDPQSDNYIVQKMYKIRGYLDRDLLEKSWVLVASHFDILRTAFTMGDGLQMPVQFILAFAQIKFRFLDFSSLENEIEDKFLLDNILMEDRKDLFSLKECPLMRLKLIKISEQHHALLWTMHHIILDGWSVEIVFRSALSCYESLTKGHNPIIMYPSSFRAQISTVESQNRESERKEFMERKGKEFFQSCLKDYYGQETLTSLHSSLLRNSNRTNQENNSELEFTFSSVDLFIQEDILVGLKAVAASHQVTLNTLIQYAWGILTARYCRSNDVIFGLTVSGRSNNQNLDRVVGILINTLPVRIQFNDIDSLGVQLRKLQAIVRDVEFYSNISLADVQMIFLKQIESELGKPHSHHKIFDTILIFENYLGDAQHSVKGFEIYCTQTIENTEYPLSIGVTLSEHNALNFKIQFGKKYFLKEHVHSIADSLHNLLQELIQQPEKSWERMSIVSPTQMEIFNKTFNCTSVNYKNCTVVDLIFSQGKNYSDTLSVIDGYNKFTYMELLQHVNFLANHIEQLLGDVRKKRFMICLERSMDLIVAILAVLKVGATYIPVDPSFPKDRIIFIKQDSEAISIITKSIFAESVSIYHGKCIYLDDICFKNSSEMLGDIELLNSKEKYQLNDIAYIIYTSGSSGKPKGVLVTHENLSNYLQWAKKQYFSENSENDNLVPLHSSISFDISITSMFVPLISGRTIITVSDPAGIVGFLDLLKSGMKFSLLKLTPSHLAIINESFPNEGSLPKVKTLVIGGENLTSSQIQRWVVESPETRIFNEYGPAECTIGCTIFEVTQASIYSFHSIPIGYPISNTTVHILDKGMQLVPKYCLGELYVSGKGLTRGYLNLAEKTKDSFVMHPFGEGLVYRTGDIVRYGDDGILEYLGRSDDQIKFRGYRIETGEIEYALRCLEGVVKTVVILIKGQLTAFIVSNYFKHQTEIIFELEKTLPKFMIPSNVIFMDSLPLASSGKVDVLRLSRSIAADDLTEIKIDDLSETQLDCKETEIETQLIAIWKEILDLEVNRKVTIEDNFFQLGGHSLMALRFVNLAETRLGIHFPLSKIFDHPTVKELANFVHKIKHSSSGISNKLPQCIITVNDKGGKVPLFLVHSGFGLATEYLTLADMDSDRPIYGINSLRFSKQFASSSANDGDGLDCEFDNVREMASYYVNILLRVREEGSVIVGGWSFGGIVALEMANILKVMNTDVKLVVLLDSFNIRKAGMVRGREDIESSFPNLSAEEKQLIYLELESNCRLLTNHSAKASESQKVLLVKATRSIDSETADDDCNGWEGVISNLDVVTISGSHYDMFSPGHVAETMHSLQSALRGYS